MLTLRRQALVKKWLRLPGHVVAKLSRTREDVRKADGDDLRSAGFLALCKAARHYDPSRGVAFSSYAWRAIVNDVLAEARGGRPKSTAHKNRRLEKVSLSSMQALYGNAWEPAAPEEEDHDHDPEALAAVWRWVESLSPGDAVIFRSRLGGVRLRDISEQVGISTEGVRQRWLRLLERLRRHLGRGGGEGSS